MRKSILWLILTGLALGSLWQGRVSAGPEERPNIVLIMADDMGFSDIGCYGSEIETPNIDRLAAEGLRFTQFYNTARCCPTRASLLTGLYQHQAGVGHMVQDRGHPSYRGFLNDRCVTIAEALREAGYVTLMSGKWHIGENRPHWPTDRGFDRYFGLISGGSNYFRLDPGRKMAIDDRPYTPEGDDFYMTDAFSDSAVRFLGRHGRGPAPFFLYVPYTAPHWPLHAKPADIAKYEGKYSLGWDALRRQRRQRMIDLGIVKSRWPMTERDPRVPAWEEAENQADWAHRMAVYAAQIDSMDQGIGRILDKLDEIGARENTLVLFLADNGGCAEIIDRGTAGVPAGPADSFLSYGIGWANASNTPFRLYKHWVHEGGISTPLVARWPAGIQGKGRLTRQPGHLIDIMATCVDLAGGQYPRQRNGQNIHPLEGQSLRPIFAGRRWEKPRLLYWEHEGNRAVREGKWKLVSRHPGEWELYDLRADRTETRNLAEEQPRRVARMKQLYAAWAERCEALPWNRGPVIPPALRERGAAAAR